MSSTSPIWTLLFIPLALACSALPLAGADSAPPDAAHELHLESLALPMPRAQTPAPADTVAITARVIDRMLGHFAVNRPGRPIHRAGEWCLADEGDVCHGLDHDRNVCDPDRHCDSPREMEEVMNYLLISAVGHPHASFVVGYAAYTHVRLGRPDVALVISDACAAAEWWCDLVAGHAYQAQGLTDRSVERLDRALTLAPDSIRCELMDPGRLMEPGRRRAIQRQSCDTRIPAADTVWWLADPLYSREGNDRLAEHVSRVHEARMRAILTGSQGTPDLRFTHEHLPRWYLDEVTENRVRRGAWDSWEALKPSPALNGIWFRRFTGMNAAPYSFVPDFDGEGLANAVWRLAGTISDEGYRTSYGSFHEIPTQIARFRRGDSVRVAVTGSITGTQLIPSSALEPHLIFSDGPGSFPVHLQADLQGEQIRFLAAIPADRFVVSHEVIGARKFGRHRSILDPPDLEGFGVSDLLLYDPADGTPPEDLESAARLMVGGAILEGAREVGVYWETYGTEPETPIRISFTSEGERPGFLRRLLGVLPGVGTGGTVAAEWNDFATGPAQGRSHTIDLTGLERGDHVLVLRTEWADEEAIEVRRPFEIR